MVLEELPLFITFHKGNENASPITLIKNLKAIIVSDLNLMDASYIFMKYILLNFILGPSLVFIHLYKTPGSAEFFYHRKVKGSIPCLVGGVVDSENNHTLTVGALVVDKTVYKPDKMGVISLGLLPGKHKLSARFYSYCFIEKIINVQKGDSINFRFYLNKSKEMLY